MHVVADENERPFVLLERADQGVDRADVEMRRRLVHEQKIRRIEQQFDEREARFLAAAQDADRLENIVAAEKERAENGSGGLFRNRIRRHRARSRERFA